MTALKSMSAKTKERRKRVIESYERQLAEGTKPNKEATTKEATPYIPLTKKDIDRIKKEIEVLKTRI